MILLKSIENQNLYPESCVFQTKSVDPVSTKLSSRVSIKQYSKLHRLSDSTLSVSIFQFPFSKNYFDFNSQMTIFFPKFQKKN